MPPPSRPRLGSFASAPLMDDKENAPVRAPGVNANMNSTKHAVATAMGVRPTLGRDTAPALLRLGRPEDVPVLRFADARAGGVKTLHLRLQNDTPYPQEVHFENIPREDGFLVDPDRSSVLAGASQLVRVSWCPARPTRSAYCGTMRVTIDDGEGDAGRARRGTNGALRVRVRGDAVASPEPSSSENRAKAGRASGARGKPASKWNPRRASSASALRSVDNVLEDLEGRRRRASEECEGSPGAKRSRRGAEERSRVAPVGKTLRLKTAIRDAGADSGADSGADCAAGGSRWMERRERAFAEWLDATVAPAEASSAPSRRRDADRAARSRLWALYSADAETRDVILRVEAHIDEGRLRLRGVGDGADANPAGINPKSGGSFMEDVRLRDEFRVAVSSYATFWLRAAVDTVVGARATDAIARGSNDERAALVEALMRDEELEREFDAGRGRRAEGYLEALSGTVLKRALLLAFLLDRAQAGLPVNTPLLFRRDAPCKSSADVVRAALQASCHGEGDVLRHLALMGYRLYHSQEPIREYDFRVKNLAVDLRDGVRLCRLVDVLGERRGDDSAVAAARFPATSRAAKLHNVRVALDAAAKLGVELPSDWSRRDPADVVDGHLANTLGLLYALQMHFQAPKLIPKATLDEETEAWRERRREMIVSGLGARGFHAETLAPAARNRATIADEDARAEMLLSEEMADHDIGREDVGGRSAHETRLLRWARAVGACVGVEVNDLSASFADGAALCALTNAYAPRLLSLRSVRRVPREDPGAPPRARPREIRAAVASNFALAAKARDAMGGVPDPNFGGADDVAPDARVVAGHLLFLCARLTRYREEEAAAIVVQRRWRWIKPGYAGWNLWRWTAAATTIARRFRGLLGRREADARRAGIARAQAIWRGRVAREEKRRAIAAATLVAARVRGWIARERYADAYFATLIAQTAARGAAARRRFLRLRAATIAAQAIARGARQRRAYLDRLRREAAATKLKAAFKGWMARFDYLETRETTIRLQATRRGAATRRAVAELLAARDAATKIQARWRGRRARRAFVALRDAAIVAQANARAAAATRALRRLRRAVVAAQARWRGWFARERYLDALRAATTCQAIRRGAAARRSFLRLRDAAVAAQSARRGKLARDGYLATVRATRVAQAAARRAATVRAARRDAAARRAAIAVQRAWRGFAGRRVAAEAREARRRAGERAAATTVQRHVRGWIAREAYLDVLCVTVVCQARRRGFVARRAFLELRDAVVTCQRRRRATAKVVEFRAMRARARDDSTRRAREGARERANRAATVVQAAWRGAAGRRRAADLRDERDAARLAAKILHRRRANEETRKMAEARRREEEEEETRKMTEARKREEEEEEETRRAAREGVASRARSVSAAAPRGVDRATVRADSSSRRATVEYEPPFVAFVAREHAAATTIQARWRGWRRRVDFAVTVWATETCQAARRRVLERRRLDRRILARRERQRRLERDWFVRAAPAATVIQAWWRGYLARDASPDEARLRRLRSSMRASRERAAENPSLRLDARVARAVETLHKPRKLREVREALRTLADAAACSRACREAAADSRALRALLHTVRRCDRSPQHEPVLAAAYELLERLSADANGPARALFEARDSVTVITEHMQMCRDRPELVASATRTLVNLCGETSRAAEVARTGKIFARVRSIAEIMANTVDVHRHRRLTYIEQARPDKAREEAARMQTLEMSIRSIRGLVARLEPYAAAGRNAAPGSVSAPAPAPAPRPPKSTAAASATTRAKSRLGTAAPGKENRWETRAW